MINKPYKSISVSRPKDRSLEAYKSWIHALTKQLDPNSEVKWTEEEWIANWKKFWKEKPEE
jgi:hypothetical protein